MNTIVICKNKRDVIINDIFKYLKYYNQYIFFQCFENKLLLFWDGKIPKNKFPN